MCLMVKLMRNVETVFMEVECQKDIFQWQQSQNFIRGRAFSGPQYVQGGVLLHKAVHCHW